MNRVDPPAPSAPAREPFRFWTLLPSPFDVIVSAAVLLSLILASFSTDLWIRLAGGHWILQRLEVPQTNLFSFTAPDYPWVNHEWLTDLGLFWVVDRLGLPWLQLLRALLTGLVVGVMWRTLRRRGGFLPSLVLVLGVMGGLLTTLDREPLLVSCLMMALLVSILESPRWTGLPAMLLVPVLFWAWASLHGAFLVGLALCWLYVVGELWDASRHRADRRWVLHVPMPMLATLFTFWNPYYTALYRFGLEELWQLMGSSAQRLQLQPTLTLGGLFLMLFGAVLILLAAGREVRWRLTLPFLFLTPIALVMPGYTCLWSVWGACTVMEHGQQVLRRIRHERVGFLGQAGAGLGRVRRLADRLHGLSQQEARLMRGPYLLLCVGVLASGSAGIPRQENAWGWQLLSLDQLAHRQRLPVAATDVLLTSSIPGARVLCLPEWSGYLRYLGEDGLQTFLDGREAAHPLPVVEDYERVVNALPGWEAILEQYEVEEILWTPGAFFPRALLAAGRWKLLYADADAVLIHLEVPVEGGAEGETTRGATPVPATEASPAAREGDEVRSQPSDAASIPASPESMASPTSLVSPVPTVAPLVQGTTEKGRPVAEPPTTAPGP